MLARLNGFATPLFLGLLLQLCSARVRAESPLPGITARTDGPYVLWEGPEARVLSVRDGKAQVARLKVPYELDLPGLKPPLRLDPALPTTALASFPAPERIAAVSDIHGNLAGLVTLLCAHGVIDKQLNWAFGKGHLVVPGDVFDRGARVTEIFWLLRHLEAQAVAAGGNLHFLLGNHEVMALRGDERYLHPDYQFLQKSVLGMDQRALYGPSSDLGRWLRARPVLLRLGPFLFAHGGPSPELLEEEKHLEAFNTSFRAAIGQEGSPRLLGRSSPIWYRGLIPGKEAQHADASADEVERILTALNVRTLVVGHSTLRQGITAFHDGRVHGIDANLQSGGSGELWLFRDGSCFRGLPDGTSLPLKSEQLLRNSGLP